MPMSKKKTILVADNEEHVREIFKEIGEEPFRSNFFGSGRGIEIIVAANVDEACLVLEDRPIDLILTDMIIGSRSGSEIIDFAKNLCPTPILAAMSKEHSLRSSLEKDKIFFFEKPLSFSRVCGWMNSQLFGPVLN